MTAADRNARLRELRRQLAEVRRSSQRLRASPAPKVSQKARDQFGSEAGGQKMDDARDECRGIMRPPSGDGSYDAPRMRPPSGDGGYDARRPDPQIGAREGRLKVVSGLDVEPKEIEWLWPGRIPAGKLTILSAFSGAGTTFVSCQLAACVTTGGSWPNGEGRAPLGEAAFLNGDDSWGDTLLPRLIAHGVNRSKVHFIEAVQDRDRNGRAIERAVRFDVDLENMRRFLESHREVRLLVVDPLNAYLGETDSPRNGEVRAVLGPLCKLAAEFGVAVVGINRLARGRGTAVSRALERMAVAAHAPAVWVHVEDRDDRDRVLWLPVKMKLARRPSGLAYRIAEGRVEWEAGEVELSAEEAMNPRAEPAKRDRVSEAAAWLRQQLAGGEWVKSAEMEEKLDEARISYATYRRAKKQLGVEHSKEHGSGEWLLRLAEEDAQPFPGRRQEPVERVEQVEPVEPLEHVEQVELLERVERVDPLELLDRSSTSDVPPSLNEEEPEGRVSQGDEAADDEWEEFDREFADFDREIDEVDEEPP